MQCIILCVAGGVSVYDTVVDVAMCVAGCVSGWCCLCVASVAIPTDRRLTAALRANLPMAYRCTRQAFKMRKRRF